MRRIFLTCAGLLALLQSYTQVTDSAGFKSRKLKIEEINLVSSYYHQEGNNAAVTGGIGSQKLTDISNVIDLKLIRYDKKQRKHSIAAEIGIDHYTSASSDMIDLKANSSASRGDTRLYPSLSWTREDEQAGTSIGAGLSYSGEYDYKSTGGFVSASVKTRKRSGELTAKFQAFIDKVNKVIPVEFRTGASSDKNESTHSRNTFAGSLSYSQIINQQLQVMILGDIIQQSGLLSLPFYRVYFNDGSAHLETLPDNRVKLPLAVRASYFAGDKIILKGFYRFYTDNWGIRSNTASLEVPVKITPFVSVSPFYRYYTQTESRYFAPYQGHTTQNRFYSSNYDLSKFNSSFFGAGIRLAPPAGVFGFSHLSMLEIRYGHYSKNIDMNANVITLHLRVK